jgi:FkbM family methyltransferase
MIPLSVKKLLPFYSARWRSRYRGMIDDINNRIGHLKFGQDGDVPWLEDQKDNVRIFGFWTEQKNAEVYDLIKRDLPAALPKTHFRLIKDYLNRYVYPHMRPDLKPTGYSVEQLWGFHGQHKDAIADQTDGSMRNRLMAAFQPKEDDVIIDGGAFLGVGDLRMSRFMPHGRIVAIEANKTCYDLLNRNISHNKVGNVTALHRALWNVPGTLDLEVGFAQDNSLVAEVTKGEKTQPVITVPIDSLVDELNLQRVTMLSLTLNGAEVEALEGATRTLNELRPRIRLAGWYKRGGVPIWQLTKAKLERHGYDVFVGPRGNVMALPKA